MTALTCFVQLSEGTMLPILATQSQHLAHSSLRLLCLLLSTLHRRQPEILFIDLSDLVSIKFSYRSLHRHPSPNRHHGMLPSARVIPFTLVAILLSRTSLSLTGANPAVLAVDLLNPTPQAEARKHKLKTLVPAPRSFFMDVKCPGCFTITTVFSHAQTVVICAGCSTVLCQPTGGKARLTEGCSFRRK
ncbi:40S ribosomal protein S27 [Helicocarpus griseus UAMH5409]|uniref:40S ribosomal protein S27 n=1 Tax=Helicocarpus griseus UAMH5409 TaxID=1447875 RepID=A0A2B7WUU7_9EURO|nr:40S ribosomal protein S27 [Helicocarpus griseus UAMH5409]